MLPIPFWQVPIRLFVLILLQPFLEVPELAATTADVVLPRRIKDAETGVSFRHFGSEAVDYLQLAINGVGYGLIFLTDNGESGFPDLGPEQGCQALGILRRIVLVVDAIVVERLTSYECGPELTKNGYLAEGAGPSRD